MSGAAVLIVAQNRYMRRFAEAGATAPARAVTLGELGLRESWAFRRMVSRGVFVRCEAGQFYLDTTAAEAFRRQRRWRVLDAALAILAGGLFGLLLAAVVGRR